MLKKRTTLSNNLSPLTYARLGGILYLLIIITGAVGQIGIRGSLIVPGDLAATADNLLAAPSLWRLGITGDIMMHVFDIPLMIILYVLLRPVSKNLALTAVAFNIIQTAVLVVNKLTLILPLILLESPEYLAVFEPAQIQAQIYLLTTMHDYGFGLGLIFFGFACLLYGYLLYKSGYFPQVIGVLMAVAGFSYLINSFTLILAPAYAGTVFPILVLSLIGELSFSVWLMTKGIRVPQ